VWVGPWRGFIFSVIQRAQYLTFQIIIFKQKEQFYKKFFHIYVMMHQGSLRTLHTSSWNQMVTVAPVAACKVNQLYH